MNEIWLKLGGDKGGGTTKHCFQLVNIRNPNSPSYTCVISIFEASDSYTNLKIVADRFRDQINDLQEQQWK